MYQHSTNAVISHRCCDKDRHEQKLPLFTEGLGRQIYPLIGGFSNGSSLSVTFNVKKDCENFYLNLQCGDMEKCSVALHCNPRVKKKSVILNSFHRGVWLQEERHRLFGCSPGSANTIVIANTKGFYKIIINGRAWQSFKHRLNDCAVSHLLIDGDIQVTSVTYTHSLETSGQQRRWQGVGGHLIRVASGAHGITWALSNDCHAYVFTGGQGGHPYHKTIASLSPSSTINSLSDLVIDYLWENQRWNPVTGFTSRGLPTDRPAWTCHSKDTRALNREDVKLPSRHWSWMSEWSIDYHTTGGCDSDGWQHATDFPYTYHSHCYVTDLVRRRRWQRRRRITTLGPWKQLERIPLIYVDVASRGEPCVAVWAVSVSGEVLLRLGVSGDHPEGTSWVIVTTDTPVISVCVDMGNPSKRGEASRV